MDLAKLFAKVWASRMLVLRMCGISAIVGLIVALSIPKEYTAETLITPERISKNSSSSSINALTAMAGGGMNPAAERDALYPSLYPAIIRSTPFLIRLFDVEVREHKDGAAIILAQYLKERQKKPWWNVITSASSKLVGLGMPLSREKEKNGLYLCRHAESTGSRRRERTLASVHNRMQNQQSMHHFEIQRRTL